MAININEYGTLLVTNGANTADKRVFIPSKHLNVFPCSRRGQNISTGNSILHYDPEARLNTERTNRLHTALNGYTDQFIINESFVTGDTLSFVLAGYYVEITNFDPIKIAEALDTSNNDGNTDIIYAHLSIHNGISLNFEDYYTEILYRQSTSDNDTNYLDVTYTSDDKTDDFFVGISFTNNGELKDYYDNTELTSHDLAIFSKQTDGNFALVETSKLPKIKHGETEDSIASIKVAGNAIIYDLDVSTNIDASTLKATTEITAPQLKTDKITSNQSEITVDKKLTLSSNTSLTAPVANVHSTLNVTNSTKTAKADIDILEADKAVVSELEVNQDAKLAKTLTVEGAATVNDTLTAEKLVASRIDASTGEDKGEVKTPKLRVNTITSDGSTVTVDDKAVVMSRDLSVLMKKSGSPKDAAATATIDKAIIGDLVVQKDDTKLTKSTGKITTGSLAVNQYLNVGSPAIPTTTTGDIVAKNSIFAENNIVAKNTLKAPTMYQTVNSSDKPVPYIDIVEQDNGTWQLQISRASAIEK